ncbi:MAG: hypothetical protein AAGD28_26100 [Bacteroidota bacterium]
MKSTSPFVFLLLLSFCFACQNKESARTLQEKSAELSSVPCSYKLDRYLGNNIQDKVETELVNIDLIDDTINFRLLRDGIYTDTLDRLLIKSSTAYVQKDCNTLIEFFQDYSDFINLDDFRPINQHFFINNGKVYIWHINSEGRWPMLIEEADAESFEPIEGVAAGRDKSGIIYGSPHMKFNRLNLADPKNTTVHKGECWNCGENYLVDSQQVYISSFDYPYYVVTIIVDADPHSFRPVWDKDWDGEDKNYKYLKGKKFNEQESTE